jgi:hypothetical protein
MRLKAVFFLFLFAISWSVNGQKGHLGPIQLSGVVVTQEKGQPVKMPYVTIAVEGTSRGTYTNWDGFFSLVVEKGETIVFSYVGYKTVRYQIPDTLTTKPLFCLSNHDISIIFCYLKLLSILGRTKIITTPNF